MALCVCVRACLYVCVTKCETCNEPRFATQDSGAFDTIRTHKRTHARTHTRTQAHTHTRTHVHARTQEFPDGFPGYHRYRCTHDPRQSCVIDTDCQATAKDGVDARCVCVVCVCVCVCCVCVCVCCVCVCVSLGSAAPLQRITRHGHGRDGCRLRALSYAPR